MIFYMNTHFPVTISTYILTNHFRQFEYLTSNVAETLMLDLVSITVTNNMRNFNFIGDYP